MVCNDLHLKPGKLVQGYCIYQQTLFIWSLKKIGKIKYGSEKDGLKFDLKHYSRSLYTLYQRHPVNEIWGI